MDAEKIRVKIKNGLPSVGSWLQLPSADVAELMGKSGYDWLAVDMEHASFGISVLPDIFRGIECGGSAPFARLPEATRVWIKAALEAGAQGLIFPMIESAAQLEEAISLATYPGRDFWRETGGATGGRRGVGFCRANDFGKSFGAYMNEKADKIFIAAQIEHIGAVRQIDAILAHKRLDAILVGPYDLSGSMGITGQFDHPDFREAMNRIAQACKKYGVAMGAHVVQPDPEALKQEIARGSRFIAYGIDSIFLWQGCACPSIE